MINIRVTITSAGANAVGQAVLVLHFPSGTVEECIRWCHAHSWPIAGTVRCETILVVRGAISL